MPNTNTNKNKKLLSKFSKDFYLEKVIPALKEEKAQRYITFVLTLFAICFFSVFAIAPTLTTIVDLQKQLEDNKFVDFQLQQKISALSTLEQRYTAIQETLPAIYAALPQTPQVPLLFGEIQALANTNQVKVARIQSSTELAPLNDKKGAQSFEISFDIAGQKDTLFAFLTDLTKLDRIMTLERITIAKNEAKEIQPGLTGELRLSIRAKAHFQTTKL